jgi:hypothetical protein
MDNRKINRLRRWAREGIILVLLTLAVVELINTENRHSPPVLVQRR